MSETLDERVVKLEFDNSKFEKNVKTTQKSLEQLDEQLKFKDGVDGIKKIEASFSHLEMVAFTIVNRITNCIIDLGINLVKSLSVDNMSAGWVKFGDKTVSVATMAAQKIKIAGKAVEDYSEKMEIINEQLDKLNWFTDETSYNFTDMVDNIGKFTAAGRSLDESVNAMMGIATWAALSGQNAATASRAMYQLSQSLGKGYVQWMDWQSIQNVNMDIEEFREKTLATAVAVGELTKEGNTFITKTGKRFTLAEFTDSLSSKWLTSDVLLNTLGEYSSAVERLYEICEEEGITATEAMELYGDELNEFGLKAFKAAQEARTFSDVISSVKDAVSTGWMKTSELIFGDYDEVKITWTELANEMYDLFAESGNFRNEILSYWREFKGNETIFGEHGSSNQGAFWNLYDSIVAVRDLIRDSWNTVFNLSAFEEYSERAADIAEKFNKITHAIQAYTKRIKDAISGNVKIQFILNGVFNLLKIGIQIIQAIGYAIKPIIQLGKDLVSYFFDKIAALGYSLSRIQDKTSSIENAARKVNSVLTNIIETVDLVGFIDKVIRGVSKLFKIFSNTRAIEKFRDAFASVIEAFGKGSSGITSFFNKISNAFSKLISSLGGSAVSIDATGFVSPLASFVMALSSLINGIFSIVSPLVTIVSHLVNFLGLILQKIGAMFNIIAVSFDAEQASKTASTLFKFAVGAAIIVAALSIVYNVIYSILAWVHPLQNILQAVADAIWDIGASFRYKGLADIIKSVAFTLLSVAASAAILASIPVKGLVKALVAVTIIFGLVFAIVSIIDGKSGAGEVKGIGALKGMIGDAFSSMHEFAKLAKIFATFASISVALLSAAAALKIISSIKTEDIIKSTLAIIVILGALLGTVYALNKFTNKKFKAKKATKTLDSLSKALVLMAVAIRIIGSMPTDNIMNAVSAFIITMAGMTAVTIAIGKYANTKLNYHRLSTLLTALSSSLIKIATALRIVGSIKDPSGIQNGIIGITAIMGSMLLFVIGLKTLAGANVEYSKISGLLGGLSFALLAISTALVVVSSINNPRNLLSAVASLTAVMLALVVLLVAINRINTFVGQKIVGVIFGLIGMSAALIILSISLAALAKAIGTMGSIDWIAFAKLATGLAIIGLLARPSAFDGLKLAALGAGLLVLSVGIAAFSASLSSITDFNLGIIPKIAIALLIIRAFAKSGFIRSAKIAMLGVSLVALGSGLSVLSAGLKALYGVEWEAIGKLLVYATVIKMFAKSGKIKSTKILMFAGVLAVLGLALAVFSGSLATLQLIDWSTIGKLTVSLISIITLASVAGTTAPLLVALGLSLIPLSLGLLALIYAMESFESIEWETLGKAAAVMAASLLALAVITRFFIKSYDDIIKIIMLSASLPILGAGMIVLAEAMKRMESVSWETLIKSLIAMAGALALVVLASNFIGSSSRKLLALGVAVALLGTGLLLIAIALKKFASAMPEFLKGLIENAVLIAEAIGVIAPLIINALMDSFKTFLERITELIPYIAEAVIQILAAITRILREGAPDLIIAIFDIISLLLSKLVEHTAEIVTAIGTILLAVMQWIVDNASQFGHLLLDFIIKIVDVIITRMPELVAKIFEFINALIINLFDHIGPTLTLLVDKLFDFIKYFIPMLLDRILSLAGTVAAAIIYFLGKVIALVITSLGSLAKLLLDLLTGFILLVVEVAKGLGNIVFQAIRTILYNVFNILSNVLVAMVTDIPKLLGGAFGKVFGAILNLIGDMINKYVGGLFGLGDVIKGWGNDISKAASDSFDESILRGDNVIAALNEARSNISNVTSTISGYVKEDVAEGLDAIRGLLSDSMDDIGLELSDKAKENAENIVDKASKAAEDKIEENKGTFPSIADVVDNMMDRSISNRLSNTLIRKDTFPELGSDMALGLANGINKSQPAMIKAGTNSVLSIETAMRQVSETHSPSRLFAELGSDLVSGLVVGLENSMPVVDNTITRIMNETINAIRTAMATDINNEVVIRPVLDLSAVSSGAQSLSALMSNASNSRVSLSGSLADSVQTGTRRTTEQTSTNQNGTVINNETYNPVFNITSNDPEEVAKEVDIRLQRMRAQATLAKGGVR